MCLLLIDTFKMVKLSANQVHATKTTPTTFNEYLRLDILKYYT